MHHYDQLEVFRLLDRARLAEASDDTTFWNQSSEVKKRIYIQNHIYNII